MSDMIVAALAGAPGVRGSKRGYRCSECSAEVQLAPSGQAYVLVNKAHICCMQCFFEKHQEPYDVNILPGCIDELRAHFAWQTRN
jgi:hypothetical protein